MDPPLWCKSNDCPAKMCPLFLQILLDILLLFTLTLHLFILPLHLNQKLPEGKCNVLAISAYPRATLGQVSGTRQEALNMKSECVWHSKLKMQTAIYICQIIYCYSYVHLAFFSPKIDSFFLKMVFYLFIFIFFLAAQCGMQDLSSPTRDQTHATCCGSTKS